MAESLKIKRVSVFASSAAAQPGDDSFFIALDAADQTGWYGPVAESIAEAVQQIGSALSGELVFEHEALHATMRLAPAQGVTRRDRSWAIGAIDCAAWDLHSKCAGQPVAALLGEHLPRAVPCYASWLGFDVSAHHAAGTVARVASEGWAFTKWSLRAEGVDDGRSLARTAELAAAAAGGTAAFDALGSWMANLAIDFSQMIDAAMLIWLEDPTSEPHHDCLALTRLPLALGERLLVDDDPVAFLDLEGLTAFTIDVVGCGGLTRASQLVGLAGQAGIKVYPHGRSFIPALHLAAAYPAEVSAVEYRLQWEPQRQLLYKEPVRPSSGLITVGDAPGLSAAPRSP